MAVQSEISTITQASTESLELVHGGGTVEVSLQGNFDGCTVTLHGKLPGADYGPVEDVTTGNNVEVVAGTTNKMYSSVAELPPCTLKLVATTAGASTNVLTVLRTRQFS